MIQGCITPQLKMNTEKPIIPRDFTQEEILEINNYITANVPYSILQTTLPITENPEHKARVYTIIFRFINGAKNYVSTEITKGKLSRLLKENKKTYEQLYKKVIEFDGCPSHYGKSEILSEISSIYLDFDNNMKINNFIDVFLVFAEKQILINIDEVTGLNMDTEEGKDAYEKLNGGESNNDSE